MVADPINLLAIALLIEIIVGCLLGLNHDSTHYCVQKITETLLTKKSQ